MSATSADAGRVVTGGRNPVVDLVRATRPRRRWCSGHWLKQGWYVDDAGSLHRAGLLGVAPWTHPLTWVFQVMPLFFLVGGYVNALSWRHARDRGVRATAPWLAGRVEPADPPAGPAPRLLGRASVPVAPLVGTRRGVAPDRVVGLARADLVPGGVRRRRCPGAPHSGRLGPVGPVESGRSRRCRRGRRHCEPRAELRSWGT